MRGSDRGLTGSAGPVRPIEKILLFLFAFSMQFGCFIIQINRLKYFVLMMTAAFLLYAYMIWKHRKILMPRTVYVFLLWMIFCSLNALFLSPFVYGYSPKVMRILYEGSGILVLVVFVVLAYNLCLRKKELLFLKYVSYTALVIALSAIFIRAGNDSAGGLILYYYGERFCGLAGNPNDYMVVVFVAIAYFSNRKEENRIVRIAALLILLYSMIASGSKGGIVALGGYLVIYLMGKEWEASRRSKKILYLLILQVLAGGAVLFLLSLPAIKPLLENFKIDVPGVDRILYLITNFKDGLSANGSLRIEAWLGTLKLIRLSPFLGIGIGGFTRILDHMQYPYSAVMPHNMYLEFLSQSGVLIFFAVSVCFIRSILRSLRLKSESVRIIRHALYLLLMNGLFMAADWFPIFWILVGMLLCQVHHPRVTGNIPVSCKVTQSS